jgi:hypothetical protein
MASFEYKRAWCVDCVSWSKAEKEKANSIFHFIMTVLTMGMWSIIWGISCIDKSLKGFRCSKCGSKKLRRKQPN